MKMLFFTMLASGAILLLVAGCSKKSSGSPSQSKLQLLMAGTWKYDTAGIDLNGDGTIDEALPSGTIPSCVTDNTLTFTSDSTGVENDGAIRCDTASPQTNNFVWSFNTTQTAINFPDSVFGSFGGTVNITSLTSTQLHLEQAFTESGITVNVAVYLSH